MSYLNCVLKRKCHLVLVVPDVSVYDPAMSDSLILVGRLIEASFSVNHRIPSQANEDGFSLKAVPLYGGTIMTPDGKTMIVMEYAQHTSRGESTSAVPAGIK